MSEIVRLSFYKDEFGRGCAKRSEQIARDTKQIMYAMYQRFQSYGTGYVVLRNYSGEFVTDLATPRIGGPANGGDVVLEGEILEDLTEKLDRFVLEGNVPGCRFLLEDHYTYVVARTNHGHVAGVYYDPENVRSQNGSRTLGVALQFAASDYMNTDGVFQRSVSDMTNSHGSLYETADAMTGEEIIGTFIAAQGDRR